MKPSLSFAVVAVAVQVLGAVGDGGMRYRGVMSPDVPVEADIRDLAGLGANLIRFQMNGNGVEKPSRVETKEEKLAWFDKWISAKVNLLERELVPWARKYGVKIVVDMHDSPGGRDPKKDSQVCMYYDADYAAKFVETWESIARRLAPHSDVLYGYDLFNEPNEADEPIEGCDYWTLQVRAGQAVRRADAKTPIIIAAKNWDLPRGFRHLKPVPLENVIYQVHVYDPHEFTHQGIGNANWTRYPGADPKTGRVYDRNFIRRELEPVVEFQKRHGVKIYVGEFSAIGYADGAADYIADVISILEEQGWDWTYHAWREWSGWSAEHVCVDREKKTFVASTEETDRMRVLKAGFSGWLAGQPDLHDLFAAPPHAAKLQAIWHWMGDNIRREAIVRDLRAMKDIDVGTVCIIAPHMVWMPYEVRLMTPRWLDLFTVAIAEAKKHGITLGFHNCPGWSASGGPWIDPAHSMKAVVSSDVVVSSDGTTVVPELPLPPAKMDFYRDISVWAFPDGDDPRVVAEPNKALENPKTLPSGRWRVVRVGYTTTGKGPAPSTLKGLECDKFSSEALDIHWKAMPAKILSLPGAKGTVDFCFIDSFEAGSQNWSENVPDAFAAKYGRPIGVELLTLAGYRVGGDAENARCRREFSALFGDLIATNYYGHFTELCHRAGIRSAVEPYGAETPMREVVRRIDVPTAEFWLGRPMADPENPRKVSEAALEAGHEIVAAESFTTDVKSGRWQATPAQLRQAGDFQAWLKGVNQIVYHSYVMQPYVNLRPGMSLGQHGTQLNVNTTWWPEAVEWSRYVARGQALLQAGTRHRGGVSVPAPLKAIRRDRGKERIYFLANDSAKPYGGWVALPFEKGTFPELFNAVDGSVSAASRNEADQVAISLAPSGSVFVVWTDTGKTFSPIEAPLTVEREFSDGWDIVSFDGVSAPSPRAIGTLVDWTSSADEKLRYFSGRARYRHALGTSGERTLDLGDVREVANVFVDGCKVACLWQKPYVTKIPAGRVLEVEVINTWPNRLIGDAIVRKRGADEPMPKSGPRFPIWVTEGRGDSGTGISTWSNFIEAWTAEDALRPAGLLGPVKLLGPRPSAESVDPRVRTFIAPVRIMDAQKTDRVDVLLRERFGQVSEGRFCAGSAAVIHAGGMKGH